MSFDKLDRYFSVLYNILADVIIQSLMDRIFFSCRINIVWLYKIKHEWDRQWRENWLQKFGEGKRVRY